MQTAVSCRLCILLVKIYKMNNKKEEKKTQMYKTHKILNPKHTR